MSCLSLFLFLANNQLVSALAQHERTKRNKRAAEPSSAATFTFTYLGSRQDMAEEEVETEEEAEAEGEEQAQDMHMDRGTWLNF